jgi:hypothetical protein
MVSLPNMFRCRASTRAASRPWKSSSNATCWPRYPMRTVKFVNSPLGRCSSSCTHSNHSLTCKLCHRTLLGVFCALPPWSSGRQVRRAPAAARRERGRFAGRHVDRGGRGRDQNDKGDVCGRDDALCDARARACDRDGRGGGECGRCWYASPDTLVLVFVVANV